MRKAITIGSAIASAAVAFSLFAVIAAENLRQEVATVTSVIMPHTYTAASVSAIALEPQPVTVEVNRAAKSDFGAFQAIVYGPASD